MPKNLPNRRGRDLDEGNKGNNSKQQPAPPQKRVGATAPPPPLVPVAQQQNACLVRPRRITGVRRGVTGDGKAAGTYKESAQARAAAAAAAAEQEQHLNEVDQQQDQEQEEKQQNKVNNSLSYLLDDDIPDQQRAALAAEAQRKNMIKMLKDNAYAHGVNGIRVESVINQPQQQQQQQQGLKHVVVSWLGGFEGEQIGSFLRDEFFDATAAAPAHLFGGGESASAASGAVGSLDENGLPRVPLQRKPLVAVVLRRPIDDSNDDDHHADEQVNNAGKKSSNKAKKGNQHQQKQQAQQQPKMTPFEIVAVLSFAEPIVEINFSQPAPPGTELALFYTAGFRDAAARAADAARKKKLQQLEQQEQQQQEQQAATGRILPAAAAAKPSDPPHAILKVNRANNNDDDRDDHGGNANADRQQQQLNGNNATAASNTSAAAAAAAMTVEDPKISLCCEIDYGADCNKGCVIKSVCSAPANDEEWTPLRAWLNFALRDYKKQWKSVRDEAAAVLSGKLKNGDKHEAEGGAAVRQLFDQQQADDHKQQQQHQHQHSISSPHIGALSPTFRQQLIRGISDSDVVTSGKDDDDDGLLLNGGGGGNNKGSSDQDDDDDDDGNDDVPNLVWANVPGSDATS